MFRKDEIPTYVTLACICLVHCLLSVEIRALYFVIVINAVSASLLFFVSIIMALLLPLWLMLALAAAIYYGKNIPGTAA
jgi:hypothetical protein